MRLLTWLANAVICGGFWVTRETGPVLAADQPGQYTPFSCNSAGLPDDCPLLYYQYMRLL